MRKTLFNNGLTVLTAPSDTNGIVGTTILIRSGGAFETDEQAGLSELTQNLLLKGTRGRTARRIVEQLEAIGARLSCSAGRDFSTILLVTPADAFEAGLEVLFDVMLHPTFPPEEVAREKDLALQKIKAREDRLLTRSLELLAEQYYGTHPYHKPLLGYPETVRRFEREEVAAFFRKHYVPGSMAVSAVGKFDADLLLRRLEGSLGALPGGTPIPSPKGGLPERTRPSETYRERKSEAAWISIGYPAPEIMHAEYPAMEVLDGVMGGSMSSRLFVELRDRRGLAYEVGSSYAARPGPSLYAFYIGTKPEQIEEARDGILEQARKIRDQPVPEEELARAKTYLKGTFLISQERNIGRAALLARLEFLGLEHRFADRYPELIDRVTGADVLRVARRYFDDNYTLAAVVPTAPVTSI